MRNDRFKILLIEDEPDLRLALKDEIEVLNFDVVTASCGEDALNTLKTDSLIIAALSDIRMPGMSGLECLQKAREIGLNMPFVFITGFPQKDLITEALRLGAVDFLEKPCSSKDLVRSVRQALRLGMFVRSVHSEFEKLADKYAVSESDRQRFRIFFDTTLAYAPRT